MGFDFEAEKEASAATPPKLSLYKLPSKQKEPQVMFTPPISTTTASIPFEWEEAPGKPRAHFTKNKNISNSSVARCLDLPPRLQLNNNTTDSSPTTVLEGPYNDHGGGRSFSQYSTNSTTFSSLSKEGSFRSLEEQIFREVKCQHQHHGGINIKEKYSRSFKFFSWRWGSSYKENSSSSCSTGRFSSGTFDDFTSSSGTSFAPSKSHRISGSAAKPPSFKRRSSFLSFSKASSNLFAGIYGSFKQVVPRRRRQEQKKA
ncbi:hypothetical protein ACH5RR_019807 [Cinchona calisaya]|uniref:Uncharacterized protein n=1 Tax=Cinchona calisaya TaxID=153742 RepID=A0ABD2ZVP7_9GENT